MKFMPTEMPAGFVVAIVGAESSGKTTLAAQLRDALATEGRRVALVSETLREFCERAGRTPVESEQAGIAAEQTRRIAAAAATHDIVIADTTALMIAVYSELVFGDTSLYDSAQQAHRRCDLTLLTALDLPWQADGLMRDGPHVREPVDALLRAALLRAGVAHAVVSGSGVDRLRTALNATHHALGVPPAGTNAAGTDRAWHWVCERCGDADCERHLLPR
jgi:nicotinamide riboside kinase